MEQEIKRIAISVAKLEVKSEEHSERTQELKFDLKEDSSQVRKTIDLLIVSVNALRAEVANMPCKVNVAKISFYDGNIKWLWGCIAFLGCGIGWLTDFLFKIQGRLPKV